MRRSTFCVLMSVGLAVACGGSDDTTRLDEADDRPSERADAGSGELQGLLTCEQFHARYEVQPVEAFEDASVQDNNMRPAGWWVSEDGTNPGEGQYLPYEPPMDGTVLSEANFRPSDGGAPSLTNAGADCEESPRFMRVASFEPGFQRWGMSFGANFIAPNASVPEEVTVRDASEYEGLAFYAKALDPNSVTTFYVTMADDFTSGQGSGEYCRDGLAVEHLCDPFGRAIGVSGEWQIYLLPFDSMVQQGYGEASPEGRLVTEELLGMTFQMGAGTWDFAIDEIVYYRRADN